MEAKHPLYGRLYNSIYNPYEKKNVIITKKLNKINILL